MLAPDVRLEGFTAEDWTRLIHLFKVPARTPSPALGGLLVIHQAGVVRKMLHTQRGRLEREGEWQTWPAGDRSAHLAALAAAQRASWVIAAEVGALDEVMERFGAHARQEDDVITQSLSLIGIVRELLNEGRIEGWPRRLKNVPIPTHPMVMRTLDAICDEGRAIVLAAFKDGGLWTAIVLRRGPRGIDRIVGPDELRSRIGLLSGDWRRDCRHVAEAVEDRFAPLALGCFGEAEVLRGLSADGRPGAWSRAVAMRDVALSPMPLAIGVALGVDTARYTWGTLRSLAPTALRRAPSPLQLFEPAARAVERLGFNPIELLRALRDKP